MNRSSKERAFYPQSSRASEGSSGDHAMRSPYAHSDAHSRDPYHHAHRDVAPHDPNRHRDYASSAVYPRSPSQPGHHGQPALQVMRSGENPYRSMTPAQLSSKIEQFPLVSTQDVGLFDQHFRALMHAIVKLDGRTSKGLMSHLVWTLVHARNRLGNCSLERIVTNNRVGVSTKIQMAKFLMTVTDDDAFSTNEGRAFRTYMGGWLQENQGALIDEEPTPLRDCDKWVLTARKTYGAVAQVEPIDEDEQDAFTAMPPMGYPGKPGHQKPSGYPGGLGGAGLPRPPKRIEQPVEARQTPRFDDSTIESILQRQERIEGELRLRNEKKPKYDSETIDAIVARQKALEEELQMLRARPALQESQVPGFSFGAGASDSIAADQLAAEEAAMQEAEQAPSGSRSGARTRITATPPKASRAGAKKKK